MRIVKVPLGRRSYEIKIGRGLLTRLGHECARLELNPRCVIVSDRHVAPRYGHVAQAALAKAGFEAAQVTIPAGETAKSLKTLAACYDRLAAQRLERKSFIVALGGGVVGDLAGFLAATYLRGLPFVQVPTTLLAQVDSSVGGKVGLNLAAGKNLVGAFHQPRLVLCDLDTLASLPMREFRAGLAEVIKYGIIYDAGLFRRLERDLPKLLGRDPSTLAAVVARCCEIKADVVRQDERESGLRAILNFGHTIGHALESETKYHSLLHGEAVAWGMIAATNIALSVGRTDSVTAGRIADAVLSLGRLPEVNVSSKKILARLQSDKKTQNGVVHFILPREIGKVEVASDVPESAVVDAVEELRRLSRGGWVWGK